MSSETRRPGASNALTYHIMAGLLEAQATQNTAPNTADLPHYPSAMRVVRPVSGLDYPPVSAWRFDTSSKGELNVEPANGKDRPRNRLFVAGLTQGDELIVVFPKDAATAAGGEQLHVYLMGALAQRIPPDSSYRVIFSGAVASHRIKREPATHTVEIHQLPAKDLQRAEAGDMTWTPEARGTMLAKHTGVLSDENAQRLLQFFEADQLVVTSGRVSKDVFRPEFGPRIVDAYAGRKISGVERIRVPAEGFSVSGSLRRLGPNRGG